MANKNYDLVEFGTTSFVGKIFCEYMFNEYAEPNLSWAMAARSGPKLAALKDQLGDNAIELPILMAEFSDETSLR